MSKGVKFPFGSSEARYDIAVSDTHDNIKESIYIILNTRKGERFMKPDFGCRINDYLFENMNDTMKNMLKNEVLSALVKWEERISNVEIDIMDSNNGLIELEIKYNVIETGVSDTSIISINNMI